MTKWNIIVLALVAVELTFLIFYNVTKQRWEIFSFLKKESIESLERKLYGFDQSINATIITDELGKVTSINESVTKELGWEEKDLVNSDLKRIVPDRFWVAHSEGMKRAIGKEMDDKAFELYATKKDKTEIPIELLLRKRKIGKDFFYVAIIRDVSEEKRMIDMYAFETQMLQNKIDILEKGEEISDSGSWFWDLRTSKEAPTTKLYTSSGYNRIMGLDDKIHFDADYLKGNVFSKDVDIVNSALSKAFKGIPYDITYRTNRRSDFKVIYIRSIVRPIKGEDGIVSGMYGSTRLIQTLNVIDIITEETDGT